MFYTRLLAAAAIAAGGLTFAAAGATPAGAAPWDRAVVQTQHYRDRDHDGWREERRRAERDRHREAGRDDWRGDRRDYRRDEWRDDWGRHDGGDRRIHRYDGWRYGHWRAHRHPRHRYWVGRPMPRNNFVVIYDYGAYHLPPPRRGHYYARIDNEVYLVAAATRNIIEAFLLLDAARR